MKSSIIKYTVFIVLIINFILLIIYIFNRKKLAFKDSSSKPYSVEGFINIKYVNYFIDTTGWDLAFIGMESDDCIEHVFEKVEMDTSKLLTACIDANNNTYVKSYRKIYIENNLKHTILFKADTFYHYTEDIENNMTFISGEYNYRAERLLFENDEFMYYLLYRDSLGKIKGNNLPKLPQPNYDEMKRFDSLFN